MSTCTQRREGLSKSLYPAIVRHVLHPLDRWRSGDAAEMRHLREYERTQYLSPSELQELQVERLRRLIVHAYQRCPFYGRQFDAAGIHPLGIRALDDLRAVPVLEKHHIQEHRDDIVAIGWPQHDLLPNLTGGSTGRPLSFFVSRDRFCSRAAATRRHNRWAGFDVGDRLGVLWGAARDLSGGSWKRRLRNALIDRELILDAGYVTESSLQIFDAAVKRFRPKTIIAYAGAIALWARYLKSRNLPAYQPHSIITSAEVLEPSSRALIEDVFGCPVFNRYGCREVSIIASECAEHVGMHVMAEGLYVEVVRGDRAARPGEAGAVLVTDLLNLAMPLIRYRIGDVAVVEGGVCACGRGLPRIRSVEGRSSDFLVGADGRLVSGISLTLFLVARRPSLGQVQIWQEVRGQVLFKICPLNGAAVSPDDRLFLDTETKNYLGPDTNIDYECVEQLPCEPSGKYLFCRSAAACDFVD
jgi:phenylacetate-CoA ligase